MTKLTELKYPIGSITHLFYVIGEGEVKLGGEKSGNHTAIEGDICPKNINVPGEINVETTIESK